MKSIDLTNYIQLEGPLFEDVQQSAVFPDSKTFVDCTPKIDPQKILSRYQKHKDDQDFNLEHFVRKHFHLPDDVTESAVTAGKSMESHIEKLWDYLSRQPDEGISQHSSLIPLPHPYIVPGGRFREIYYWDSYFTAEGLATSGRIDMVENLISNFCFLIHQTGHVPNGNRQYYVSRSQPPFLFLLIDLLVQYKGKDAITPYLNPLKKEYNFWMDGADKISTSQPAHRRVVKIGAERVLNRYWDDRPLPREESWREDVEVASGKENPQKIYRDLRAGAESGWDFSSRWLTDYSDLGTICTSDILPADLNALLYGMEKKLSEWTSGAKSEEFANAARRRKRLYNKLFWDGDSGYYFDYNFRKEQQTDCESLVGVYPLFVQMASDEQAERLASTLGKKFLKAGGLVTTLHETGQQWDYPNGWAPLQWMAVVGLRNYGYNKLAEEIGQRWLDLNRSVFDRTGKMMEKYNVCDLSLEGGGGEYPLQDGFGWTNGVVTAMQNILD